MRTSANRESKYYVVYLAKSDEIVASGYAAECADQLKMTVHSFYSMVSRVKSGINTKYVIAVQNR